MYTYTFIYLIHIHAEFDIVYHRVALKLFIIIVNYSISLILSNWVPCNCLRKYQILNISFALNPKFVHTYADSLN